MALRKLWHPLMVDDSTQRCEKRMMDVNVRVCTQSCTGFEIETWITTGNGAIFLEKIY